MVGPIINMGVFLHASCERLNHVLWNKHENALIKTVRAAVVTTSIGG